MKKLEKLLKMKFDDVSVNHDVFYQYGKRNLYYVFDTIIKFPNKDIILDFVDNKHIMIATKLTGYSYYTKYKIYYNDNIKGNPNKKMSVIRIDMFKPEPYKYYALYLKIIDTLSNDKFNNSIITMKLNKKIYNDLKHYLKSEMMKILL